MIIHTGMRTDIPAFYADWFANRIREGFVCVRNPYNSIQVTEYSLDPSVVDLIGFCTKNPEPMLKYMDLLQPYGMYWYVTITPYGKEIEPMVPDKEHVLLSFQKLSEIVGIDSIGWRYDPIFLNETYTMDYHIRLFTHMASVLEGYTKNCVISFIDLYQKVRKNFPEVRAVEKEDRLYLGKAMIEIAAEHGMTVRPCGEGDELSVYGADCSGCMTEQIYEQAVHTSMDFPKRNQLRKECACLLGADIGAYNTCLHLCRYCYANYDADTVKANYNRHDPTSPFLIGNRMPDDKVHKAKQKSWINGQMTLADFL